MLQRLCMEHNALVFMEKFDLGNLLQFSIQMLEKQMGPESFCKVLKNLVATLKEAVRPLRTLSTKEASSTSQDASLIGKSIQLVIVEGKCIMFIVYCYSKNCNSHIS